MSQVRLSVYDLLGREVVRLVDGLQQPGSRTVDFDATNLPSGFYVYRITAGNFRDAKKLVILK